jgi:hypothetical protein
MEISMKENGLMITQMVKVGSSKLTVTTMRAAGKMDKHTDTADILQMTGKSILVIGRMTSKMATGGKSGQINLGMRAHLEME